MSLADDLRGKLDEATGRLANLGKRLDEIESLEDSLRQANGGLAQASSDISALAASARAAQESLDATLKALAQATEVMMRLEPAIITSAIETTDMSIRTAIEGSSKEISGLVSDQADAVNRSTSENHRNTQQFIRRLSQEQSKAVRVSTWIGSLTLIVMVILVILILTR